VSVSLVSWEGPVLCPSQPPLSPGEEGQQHHNLDTPYVPPETFAALTSSWTCRGGGLNEGSWTGALQPSQASTYRPQNSLPKPLTNEVKEKSGTGTKSGRGWSPDSRAAGAAWQAMQGLAVPNTLAELKLPPAWAKPALLPP